MNYDDPITCLKGIGEKTAALYEKLGIVTIGELMRSGPGRDLFLSDNKACA